MQYPSKEAAATIAVMEDAGQVFIGVNLVGMIVAQVFAGQVIKKLVSLLLILQIMFATLLRFNSPINTSSVFKELDDAVQLGMLKRLIFDQLKDYDYMQKVEDIANQSGMIIFIGLPVVALILIFALVLLCCKSVPKMKAFG
jgi:hypothetical protein